MYVYVDPVYICTCVYMYTPIFVCLYVYTYLKAFFIVPTRASPRCRQCCAAAQ